MTVTIKVGEAWLANVLKCLGGGLVRLIVEPSVDLQIHLAALG